MKRTSLSWFEEMKLCELCDSPATMYCDSDQASLCCDCDAKVHGANFLVAKHLRTLLCHVCQSPTPWNGSGPKLGPTISVCQRCVNRSRFRNETQTPTPTNDRDDEGDDEEEEDDDDDDADDEEEEDGNGDGDDLDVENEEENQVVPWSSTPPPPISCSSTSEEESSVNFCNGEGGASDSKSAPLLKRMRQDSSSDLASPNNDRRSAPQPRFFMK